MSHRAPDATLKPKLFSSRRNNRIRGNAQPDCNPQWFDRCQNFAQNVIFVTKYMRV